LCQINGFTNKYCSTRTSRCSEFLGILLASRTVLFLGYALLIFFFIANILSSRILYNGTVREIHVLVDVHWTLFQRLRLFHIGSQSLEANSGGTNRRDQDILQRVLEYVYVVPNRVLEYSTGQYKYVFFATTHNSNKTIYSSRLPYSIVEMDKKETAWMLGVEPLDALPSPTQCEK
jgi:hypothetical protein